MPTISSYFFVDSKVDATSAGWACRRVWGRSRVTGNTMTKSWHSSNSWLRVVAVCGSKLADAPAGFGSYSSITINYAHTRNARTETLQETLVDGANQWFPPNFPQNFPRNFPQNFPATNPLIPKEFPNTESWRWLDGLLGSRASNGNQWQLCLGNAFFKSKHRYIYSITIYL